MTDSKTRTGSALTGLILMCMMITALTAAGCSGTSGTMDDAGRTRETGTTPDTSSEAVRQPDFPPGKFTVQLGAYQTEDAARAVASVAGSRFTRQIYTVYDTTDRLHKVMLGMFDTKDQARQFRDTIVRQYADDYRDAWVSELKR